MGRKVYSYKHTFTIAEQMLNQAQNNENIEWHNSISTILFCAFTLEGFLNHVGDELIKDWSCLFENLNPKAKLVLLSDKFDVKIDFSKAPFQSFKIIFEIRNQLAHPKTKNLTNSKHKLKVNENIEWDADKWEVYANLRDATKILNYTKQIIDDLSKRFPIEKEPSFLLSMNK
jgi:hypothetical protein